MSAGGWIMLLTSVGIVTALFAWCLWRVLRTPGATEHLASPTDVVPSDQRQDNAR